MLNGTICDESCWYPCKCNSCGWIGPSGECGTDWGDSGDTDIYCPRCGSINTDEYEYKRYPFYHPLTNLISRIRARRIRRKEAQSWNKLWS